MNRKICCLCAACSQTARRFKEMLDKLEEIGGGDE